MKNCRQMKRPEVNAGFTLIELMGVMVIVGILAAMVLGIAGYATRKADTSRAAAEIQQILNGLEEYRAIVGRYPVQTETDDKILITNTTYLTTKLWVEPQDSDIFGHKPLLIMDGWTDEDEAYELVDPWGNAYGYISKGGLDAKVWSYGPNVDVRWNNGTIVSMTRDTATEIDGSKGF